MSRCALSPPGAAGSTLRYRECQDDLRGVALTDFDPARYGEAVGDDYDKLYPSVDVDTEAAVTFLAELARTRGQSSVLEFGIGTGRLALPLHQRGIRVVGIDASQRMVSRLREKAGSNDLEVTIGDYRDAQVDSGRFAVVLLANNAVFDPRGLSVQLEIFRNAARHLVPGGYFVVESWVMNDAQRNGDWSLIPRLVGDRHVELQLARYDIATNQMVRPLLHLYMQDLQFVTVSDTYAAPGELDVMAHVTGFRRIARYGGWDRSQFTAVSANQVSIYELNTLNE